jgi:hypothetical protein
MVSIMLPHDVARGNTGEAEMRIKNPLKEVTPQQSHSVATLIVRGRIRALAIIGLTALVLAGFVVRAHNGSANLDKLKPSASGGLVVGLPGERSSTAAKASPALAEARPMAPETRLETTVVIATPEGFEPPVITRSKGPFYLLVRNHTGLQQATLRIDQVAGGHVGDTVIGKDTINWDNVFDLAPGTYDLTEALHPDWLCRINVKQ